jgi:hypothetical protein
VAQARRRRLHPSSPPRPSAPRPTSRGSRLPGSSTARARATPPVTVSSSTGSTPPTTWSTCVPTASSRRSPASSGTATTSSS